MNAKGGKETQFNPQNPRSLLSLPAVWGTEEDDCPHAIKWALIKNWPHWDEGKRGVRREGTRVYLWLIHDGVWQKPSQCCKVIILQLK